MRQRHTPESLEPCALYLRKSREDREAEARGEGETLAKHRKELYKLAKELNVNITKVFPELESGESIIHRPEMMQLLKEVGDGKWRSVFCMEIDRLGRGDMEDQGLILKTFKNSNTLIVTPRKVYDLNDEFDEEYTEFEAFMARKELKIITRRLQGGRVRSVEDGNYIGTRPPYGYLIERKNRQERTLIPHPDQAPVVQLIFELYTHDDNGVKMGSSKIAAELNRLGKATYTGKPWEAASVLNIIKNEIYAGLVRWKKKEIKKSITPGKKKDTKTRPRDKWIVAEGKHVPLITMETYNKAQTILKGKYHVPYQLANGITNPLAGLIKCELCGNSMVYRPYAHQQYPHIICHNSQCPNKSSRFEYVEKEVLEGLASWLAQYIHQYSECPPEEQDTNVIDFKTKILQNLTKEYKELGQQKERLHELLERRIYDEATYLDRSQKLSERIASVQIAIAETEAAIKAEEKREQARKDVIPNVKRILEIYHDTADPAIKNKMLKSVLEYATYKKEKHQRDDDFTLVLYPRLPKE